MTLLNQDYKCTQLSTRNSYPLEKLKTDSNHNYNENVVSVTACWQKIPIKVIRHVFGFGIEFLENKDIGIFEHFIVIDFIKRYSYHTYFSPILTS